MSKTKPSLVYGKGINDYDGTVSYINTEGKSVLKPFYSAWIKLLSKCYCPKFLQRCPTYVGCTVSKEWLSLSIFKKWFDIHHVAGFHLDKDLYVKGNKIYSANTCFYIPQELNKIFLTPTSQNHKFPQGVSLNSKSGKIHTQLRKQNKVVYLGSFPNTSEGIHTASEVYQVAKHKYVQEVIASHKNDIHPTLFIHLTQEEVT